jgi:hypothetical protein
MRQPPQGGFFHNFQTTHTTVLTTVFYPAYCMRMQTFGGTSEDHKFDWPHEKLNNKHSHSYGYRSIGQSGRCNFHK